MKKVSLALLGLILLVILSYLCFQNKADTIRDNLISAVDSTLSQHNIVGVTATLQGENIQMTDIITLTGEVASLQLKEKVQMLVHTIEGVGSVDNRLIITKKQTKKVVTPTQEQVEATPVPDTTTVAETKRWKNISQRTLSDTTTVAVVNPYSLNISKDKNSNITLEGYVDNDKYHHELIAYAQKLFGSKNVTDNLKVTSGAPKDWEYISAFALKCLKDVDYGEMKLKNQSYEFTAHLPSPSTKADFLNGIREVMSDPENKYSLYRGDYIITAPVEEPSTLVKKELPKNSQTVAPIKGNSTEKLLSCQSTIDKLLKNQKILFDYNKATINKNSYVLLDKVLKSIKNCHVSLLEIAGHTDNQGEDAYNKLLSKLRAASVKKYLIRKGFDKKKLKAVGYGESKPIASNRTSQGRAANRRIELIVKGVEK